MMVTGFRRVLASGVLLLLPTSTTTLVCTAGAISTATYSSDSTQTACATEVAAYLADETCTSCAGLDEATVSTELEACGATRGVNDREFSELACDDRMAGPCCLDLVNRNDCLDNVGFVDYWMCFLESMGCSGEITCEDIQIAGWGESNGDAAAVRLGDASTTAAAADGATGVFS